MRVVRGWEKKASSAPAEERAAGVGERRRIILFFNWPINAMHGAYGELHLCSYGMWQAAGSVAAQLLRQLELSKAGAT